MCHSFYDTQDTERNRRPCLRLWGQQIKELGLELVAFLSPGGTEAGAAGNTSQTLGVHSVLLCINSSNPGLVLTSSEPQLSSLVNRLPAW